MKMVTTSQNPTNIRYVPAKESYAVKLYTLKYLEATKDISSLLLSVRNLWNFKVCELTIFTGKIIFLPVEMQVACKILYKTF